MTSFKYKKAVQALNYFATKEGGKINYMKAVKLIWLADRLHVRIYGRTITNDTYVAMKNGTVPSGTKDIVLKSGFSDPEMIDYANEYISPPNNYEYSTLKDVDYPVFSKTDLRIMDLIYDNYKHYDRFELSEYSHLFPEWIRFENELRSGTRGAFHIEIDDLFIPMDEEEIFHQDEELLALSKEHFKETV